MCIHRSIIFVALLALVNAENDELACCPGDLFISYTNLNCWTRDTNNTVPLRIRCEQYFRTKAYVVNSGNVELQIGQLPPRIIGPQLACTGNELNKKLFTTRTVALLCYDKEEPQVVADEVLGGCMIVSVIFLTLIAVIYGSLPEIRDLNGKSIINLCASLAIGFGILSIMKLMAYSDMNMCAVRGFLAYFFILAAFFWSNAISFQILRCTRKPSIADHGWKEFRWYALYSWGCPAVLTIMMAVVNFHPGNHSKPGLGLSHCWFIDKEQQWYYMYSVMATLLTVNIIIFIYTFSIVWNYSFSSGHIRALRYRLNMAIRMILVMGILWVFEMISSMVKKHIVWGILDVVNTLQGPSMFLVLVVFRKRVIKAMLAHGWLDCISGPVEKYLAAGSDGEENVIQHTDIPMNDH